KPLLAELRPGRRQIEITSSNKLYQLIAQAWDAFLCAASVAVRGLFSLFEKDQIITTISNILLKRLNNINQSTLIRDCRLTEEQRKIALGLLTAWQDLPGMNKLWNKVPIADIKRIIGPKTNKDIQAAASLVPTNMDRQDWISLVKAAIIWLYIPKELRGALLEPNLYSSRNIAKLAEQEALPNEVWAGIYRSENPTLLAPIACQGCGFRFVISTFERLFEEEWRMEQYRTAREKKQFVIRHKLMKLHADLNNPAAYDLANYDQLAEAGPFFRATVRYGIYRECCFNSLMTGYSVLPRTATLDSSRLISITSRMTTIGNLRAQKSIMSEEELMANLHKSQAAGPTQIQEDEGHGSGYNGLGRPIKEEEVAVMSHKFFVQPGVRRVVESDRVGYYSVPTIGAVDPTTGEFKYMSETLQDQQIGSVTLVPVRAALRQWTSYVAE
ncbi:hypothetical protein KDA11_01415, partial [Candidatus Saccharibacteria bacterium]|nr:hypothetical protein [Candidatus Saccharibacteria bacterium]